LNIAGDTKQLKSNRAFQNVKVITLAMKLGVIFSNLLIGRVGFSWCEALGCPRLPLLRGKNGKALI